MLPVTAAIDMTASQATNAFRARPSCSGGSQCAGRRCRTGEKCNRIAKDDKGNLRAGNAAYFLSATRRTTIWSIVSSAFFVGMLLLFVITEKTM